MMKRAGQMFQSGILSGRNHRHQNLKLDVAFLCNSLSRLGPRNKCNDTS